MHLTTVVASVRDGRIAPAIAAWVNRHLASLDHVEHTELDLADHTLARDLSRAGSSADVVEKILDASEAFVLITPEYNHGYPAELKLLLDSFTGPWQAKPFALVGYGGQAGGIRAVEQLKPVVTELHGVPVRDGVHLTSPWEAMGTDGFEPGERADRALDTMLASLTWWADALRSARAATPFPNGHEG